MFLHQSIEEAFKLSLLFFELPTNRKTLDLFFAGNIEEARSNINRFEPILRTLAQPQVCFSFTKEILKMRGIFKSNSVRKPYDVPDLAAFTELQRLVNELELTTDAF